MSAPNPHVWCDKSVTILTRWHRSSCESAVNCDGTDRAGRPLRCGVQTVEFSLDDGSVLIKRLRSLRLFHWIPEHVIYQIMLAVLIAWVPLLVLTAKAGAALGHRVQIPLLVDLVQYARFMVALPCAIALGPYINPRLKNVLNGFLSGGVLSAAGTSLDSRVRSYGHRISRAQ